MRYLSAVVDAGAIAAQQADQLGGALGSVHHRKGLVVVVSRRIRLGIFPFPSMAAATVLLSRLLCICSIGFAVLAESTSSGGDKAMIKVDPKVTHTRTSSVPLCDHPIRHTNQDTNRSTDPDMQHPFDSACCPLLSLHSVSQLTAGLVRGKKCGFSPVTLPGPGPA